MSVLDLTTTNLTPTKAYISLLWPKEYFGQIIEKYFKVLDGVFLNSLGYIIFNQKMFFLIEKSFIWYIKHFLKFDQFFRSN